MASLNHFHTYERVKSNREVYRCIDSMCTHTEARDKIIGKAILCAKCHTQTVALQMQLRAGQNRNGTKKLTCLACSRSPRGKEILAAKETVEDLLKGII